MKEDFQKRIFKEKLAEEDSNNVWKDYCLEIQRLKACGGINGQLVEHLI